MNSGAEMIATDKRYFPVYLNSKSLWVLDTDTNKLERHNADYALAQESTDFDMGTMRYGSKEKKLTNYKRVAVYYDIENDLIGIAEAIKWEESLKIKWIEPSEVPAGPMGIVANTTPMRLRPINSHHPAYILNDEASILVTSVSSMTGKDKASLYEAKQELSDDASEHNDSGNEHKESEFNLLKKLDELNNKISVMSDMVNKLSTQSINHIQPCAKMGNDSEKDELLKIKEDIRRERDELERRYHDATVEYMISKSSTKVFTGISSLSKAVPNTKDDIIPGMISVYRLILENLCKDDTVTIPFNIYGYFKIMLRGYIESNSDLTKYKAVVEIYMDDTTSRLVQAYVDVSVGENARVKVLKPISDIKMTDEDRDAYIRAYASDKKHVTLV